MSVRVAGQGERDLVLFDLAMERISVMEVWSASSCGCVGFSVKWLSGGVCFSSSSACEFSSS